MTSSAGWMLNKNLLYTAITRAKKIVVIVTDDGAKAVKIAVSKSGSERVTKLSERLRKVRSEPQHARNEVDQAMDLWAQRASFARLAAKKNGN
jgi:phosphopantetheine adenylyltransferase